MRKSLSLFIVLCLKLRDISYHDRADAEIEDKIDTTNRRVTVSCNAWPGEDVPRSVQVYYGLMKNYVGLILTKEYEDIREDSDNLFERGLYRSTFTYFMDHWKK